MRRISLGGKLFRAAMWVGFGLFFLFPLYAMADFSTRNLIAGGRTLQAWKNLVEDDALYQAKRAGRDRCITAGAPAAPLAGSEPQTIGPKPITFRRP